jgi:hypothetical protein
LDKVLIIEGAAGWPPDEIIPDQNIIIPGHIHCIIRIVPGKILGSRPAAPTVNIIENIFSVL